MKGIIRFNSQKSKYELANSKGKTFVTSKRLDYLQRLVAEQKHPGVKKHKVTEVDVVSTAPQIAITDQAGAVIVGNVSERFTIAERFEFTEELVTMVVERTAKAVLITGEGGVGKTHTVLEVLHKAGMVDVNSLRASIDDFKPIVVEDEEDEMRDKIHMAINKPRGDYAVIKGHSSAKGLYRMLFEHRERTIVFDDCDAVLKDATAISLLKGALDTYEDRWISWNVDQSFGDGDIPTSFRFHGSVIFVSNMDPVKVDEAVRTRCFKVDVSMTKHQRIERMYAVLENLMPDEDLNDKLEALNLMERNLDDINPNNINFRSLMHTISIRTTPTVKDWKKLALFALTEKS